MSRGPGHVERAIAGILDAKPDDAFTTEELCRAAYPAAKRIEKKHRVAVLRAMERVEQRRDTLGYRTSERLGGSRVYFNWTSVQSYAMARLKANSGYQNNDPRRSEYPWLKAPTESELRKRLAKGGDYHHQVVEGGAWWQHVQWWVAERDVRRAKDNDKLIAVLTASWEHNCNIRRQLRMELPPQPPELVRLLRRRRRAQAG